LRGLETFQGTHILGALRGCLCDSKAFLFKNLQNLKIQLSGLWVFTFLCNLMWRYI